MADGQEFKLLITGDASNYVAATATAGDATKKLQSDTTGLSDEMTFMPDSLRNVGQGAKDLGGKVEEMGEKTEVSKREIREMGNELGRAAGLGPLGAAAMGGIALGAFAAGKAIEFLKGTWDDIQEAIKGPINIEVKDDEARIGAVTKAWNEYAEARKKVLDAANTPEAQAGRENKDLADKLKLLQDILKAEEEEALAALSTKKDQMSPQAYAAAQAQIRTNFGEKTTAADEEDAHQQITIKQQEEQRLRADAAAKQKTAAGIGTADSPAAQEAQALVKKNAEAAQAQLAAAEAQIELIKRLEHPDNAEYTGLGGAVQKEQDFWKFFKSYGYTFDGTGPMAQEELRKSQAEAEIQLGTFAEKDQKTRTEKKGKLLTEAGTESGQADVLAGEIAQMIVEFNRKSVTSEGTDALSASSAALTREGGAENNNTAAGRTDAVAALQAGQQATQRLHQAIVDLGPTNKELHDAMIKALADVAAENKKLAARIAQMPYNNK